MSARNLAFFGDSALYTDTSTGDETTLTVWIEEQLETIVNGYTANVWEQIYTIEIMLSDVESEPDIGDTFVIDEVIYKVHSVIENDGTTCKMAVLKQREN
jgi:hypothetical protein